MTDTRETAALIALVRRGTRPPPRVADDVERAGSALELLLDPPDGEPDRQPTLFGDGPAQDDPGAAIAAASNDLDRWFRQGITVHTVLGPTYPPNLRRAHDRPPLVFTMGTQAPADRAIAIIGSRHASVKSLHLAGDITSRLGPLNYVVISGLARGVDAAAHRAALDAGVRTDAVIGTGLLHAYPPEHRSLQAAIAKQGVVFSQLWPETPPRPEHFPQRNALMSGLARATLIIEAGPRSGTRIQARAALAQGRPVLLHEHALSELWIREFATRSNVHVITSAGDVAAVLERQYHDTPTSTGDG